MAIAVHSSPWPASGSRSSPKRMRRFRVDGDPCSNRLGSSWRAHSGLREQGEGEGRGSEGSPRNEQTPNAKISMRGQADDAIKIGRFLWAHPPNTNDDENNPLCCFAPPPAWSALDALKARRWKGRLAVRARWSTVKEEGRNRLRLEASELRET